MDTPTGARSGLLPSLLEIVSALIAGAEPVVVTLQPADGQGIPAWHSAWLNQLGPLKLVRRIDEFPVAVMEELQDSKPVLLLSPWGRIDKIKSLAMPAECRRMDICEYILTQCRSVHLDSNLMTILPSTTLTSPSSSSFREQMSKDWKIELAAYGSNLTSSLHPRFEAAIASYYSRTAPSRPLKMFQIPGRVPDGDVLNDLEGLLRRAGGECRFGYVIRDTPPPSESLAFDRHNPKIAAKREDLKRFGSLRNLDNLFTLDIPCVSPVRDREKYCGRDASGAVRLLAGRDIRRDGTIAETDESTRWAIVQPEHQIQAGDLVLRRLNSAESTIVLAEVTLADLPAAPSDTVIPLRPRSDLSVEDRLVARLFLASALARRILGATGTLGGHFRISQSELRELPIPQPDQTMSKALQDLSSVSKQLRIWAEDADAIIRSIFRDSGAQQARRRILSEGRQVRLRADAATELDDFSHIIRSRFPYPLAYRWRVAAAAASEEPRIDTYQSVLEAAEVLLCFSAQVGMAAALRADVQLQAVGQLSEKLKSGRSGPTLGDWTAILKEIATGRRLRGLDEESLLGKLRRFHSESGSSEAIHRFGVKRNDLAHLRRPTALESELSDARNDLETLYRAAIFFTEMPLIQYTRVAILPATPSVRHLVVLWRRRRPRPRCRDLVVRRPARRGHAGRRVPGVRRAHGIVDLVQLRHDRPAEGRGLHPPQHRPARHGDLRPDGVAISGERAYLVACQMSHVNSWGVPHAGTFQGARLMLPGPHPSPRDWPSWSPSTWSPSRRTARLQLTLITSRDQPASTFTCGEQWSEP